MTGRVTRCMVAAGLWAGCCALATVAYSAAAPELRVYQLHPKTRPADPITLESELRITPGLRAGLPEIRTTLGRIGYLAFSPDLRRCLFAIKGNRAQETEPAAPRRGVVSIRHPYLLRGRAGRAIRAISLYRYAGDNFSVGRAPLPPPQRVPVRLRGGVIMIRDPVTLVRGSEIQIIGEREDTVSAAFGHVFILDARSLNPGRTQMVDCRGKWASSGVLATFYNGYFAPMGNSLGFTFTGVDRQGRMRAGLTELSFRFRTRTGDEEATVDLRVKVAIAPDGTARLVVTDAARPDLSLPVRRRSPYPRRLLRPSVADAR